VKGGPAFARVDVIEHRTGQPYFTEWARGANTWLHWSMPVDRRWPEEVDVMLTLFPEAIGTNPASELFSIFIVSHSQLDDFVLQQYKEFVDFRENPIRAAKDSSGVFTYYLRSPSDVEIRVFRSQPNSEPVYQKKDLNVPKGQNLARWDFKGYVPDKGDYSARFRFENHDQQAPQPDYVLLIHVQ
jgi:hypothetical protein